jgi:hypothetical protein
LRGVTPSSPEESLSGSRSLGIPLAWFTEI